MKTIYCDFGDIDQAFLSLYKSSTYEASTFKAHRFQVDVSTGVARIILRVGDALSSRRLRTFSRECLDLPTLGSLIHLAIVGNNGKRR